MHITLKSRNTKTGPLPVTTSAKETCADACPLKTGCYAKSGPLALHWARVTTATTDATLAAIASLKPGTLWRHNQAGDLAGTGDHIDADALQALVAANKDKRGFTYTHKPVINNPANRDAVASANANGFTINLSADSLTEADELAGLNIAPVVTVLPRSAPEKLTTPQGRRVVVCPAQTREDVTCQTCQLCQRRDRDVIVGFRAHGAGAKHVDIIAA